MTPAMAPAPTSTATAWSTVPSDRIDVSAYGFQSLTEMMITEVGGDTRIAFDANDSVTLVGFSDPTALRPQDFILA